MPKSFISCDEHREINRELTRESLVLLKNNGILPLAKAPKKIAVIGPNADDITNQYGDWTFTGKFPNEEKSHLESRIENDYYTLLRGIKEIFPEAETEYIMGCPIIGDDGAEIEKAAELASKADIAILALGDNTEQNGESKDRADLELSGRQNELLAAVKATGTPTVTVMITGKPLCIGKVLELSDAVIQAFNCGDLGGLCIAEMIAGRFNPSGKLSISYPRVTGQVPCYYNGYSSWHWGKYCDTEKGYLLPFGHGLSYTSYEYTDMQVSRTSVANGESFTASVNVTNTGNMAGKETVQLYITDHYSSVMTPRINLRGFTKISLEPGETKRVTFRVTPADLALVNRKEETVVEPGLFTVYIAPCSPDFVYEETPLTKIVEVI